MNNRCPSHAPAEGVQLGPIDMWEAQEGWVYTGHGEWTPEEAGEQEVIQHTEHLQYEPDWVRAWLNKNDSDIGLCNRVREEEYPNRWGGPEFLSTPGGTWTNWSSYY